MAVLSKKEALGRRQKPVYMDDGTWEVVADIKQKVIEGGDDVLRELTAKFDKVEIEDFLVPKDKIEKAKAPGFLGIAADRIRKVNEKMLAERKLLEIDGDGYNFRLESSPIESVGLYVPGGLAVYPSSLLMLGIPAKVAGVKRIVLCTPPPVSGITLAAAKAIGGDEIYQVGGSQAIFAMAYGTDSIEPVDKIFGPGNKYVNTAKMMLGDRCGIDIFAGPSEILILADEKADPRLIKADLESQAEHGPDGDCILVTTSRELAESVDADAVVVDSIQEGIDFANQYRAEHTEVVTANSREDALKIKGGAVFIGSNTCVPMGDYGVSGSNHVIPTGGATRFQSPVSIEDFLIRTEYTEVTDPKRAAYFVPKFAELEGLRKHAQSVKLRTAAISGLQKITCLKGTIIMKNLIRKNVQALKPYTCARQTANEGILLDANENPRGKYNRYPDPYAAEVKKAYGVPTPNIFVGNGSDEAIDLLFRVFCEPGQDEVITLDPTYGMYKVSADINNVACKSILLTDDFQIDVEKTLSSVSPNTKLIFACSPNNPTGNLLNEKNVLELCERFEGIAVLDEAYVEFADAESVALKADNLVVLRTLSKAWGAAGLRVGFAIAAEWIIESMNKVKPPYNVNKLSQDAALEILKEGMQIEEILSERERVKSRLEEFGLKVFPSDANFLLFRVSQASQVQKGLQENGVVVRDRSGMPMLDDCLRVSIGTPEQNDGFLEELGKILKKIAFIDRDGVILFEPQDDFQVDSLEKYRILPGVSEGLKKLKAAGYMLVMVSNQDGRGTESFPEDDFSLVQNKMLEDLGVEFDEIFICPHFVEDNCDCKKPKTGMVDEFLKNTPINYAESFVIGDRESDMQLAENIGVRGIKGETNGVFPNPLES
ncbi:MAG: hypothetical protein ACD_13C00127G0004 [uncultured bacterium]|nr:MAG: hypothetical protein ACD_13C00127G0004 [uncultured bacterium]